MENLFILTVISQTNMDIRSHVQGPPYILGRYIFSHIRYDLNFPALFEWAAARPHSSECVSRKSKQNLTSLKNGKEFRLAQKNH